MIYLIVTANDIEVVAHESNTKESIFSFAKTSRTSFGSLIDCIGFILMAYFLLINSGWFANRTEMFRVL
jgi:hypothetical protein